MSSSLDPLFTGPPDPNEDELHAALDANPEFETALQRIYGIDPNAEPAPEETFAPTGYESFLEKLAGGLQGVQAPRPRNFLEGLVTGAASGFGAAGSRVAQARAKFEQRQTERQKAKDADRLAASRAYRAALAQNALSGAAAGRAAKAAADKEAAKAKAEAVTVDDTLVREYPGLAPVKGQTITPDQFKMYTGGTTQAAAESGARAKATAKGEGEATGTWDRETARLLAEREFAGGNPPQFGRGDKGEANRTLYYEEFAKLAKENNVTGGDIAANRRIAGAEGANLTNLQRGYGVVEQQAQTLRGNIATLNKYLEKVPDTGTLKGNEVLRPILKAFGSSAVSGYEGALEPVTTEAGRIYSAGLSGGGVLSVEQKRDLKAVADKNFTKKQMRTALEVIDQDLENRRKGLQSEIDASQKRLRAIGQPSPATGSVESRVTPAGPAYKPGGFFDANRPH